MEYDPALPPMSAQLAKRLAEAADGLRDNQFYYLYSRRTFPFMLACGKPHATQEEAFDAAATELAEKNNSLSGDDLLEQFGPYKTESEGGSIPEYDSIVINFFSNIEGSQEKNLVHSMTVNRRADAIVFNISAFDKFFLPYYTRLYGVEVAMDFRSKAKGDLNTGIPSDHGHGTALSNYVQ